MDVIYKVGVTIGIIAIYSFVTWGLGAVIGHDEFDDVKAAVCAWMVGLVLFIILALFTMEKFGLWKV